jgi:pyruvate dehydrogenase E2 component (dihydrolipoamide acetyltransferase)
VAFPDFSPVGRHRPPADARRARKTAEHLSAAWATIPHVTQHDAADITDLEETLKRYANQVEAAGGRPLTAAAVVCAAALKIFNGV